MDVRAYVPCLDLFALLRHDTCVAPPGAAAAKQAGDTCGEVNDGCGGTYDCDCGGAGSGLTCVNNKCVADVYAPCAVDGDCADHDAGGVTEEEKKVICDNGICKPTLGNYCGNWANGKETYCGLCVKNCGVKNDDRVCGAFTYAKDDSCEPKFINAKNGGGRFCAGTAVCCAPTQPSYIKSTDTLGQVDADGFGSSCDDVGAGSTCNCPSGLK